MHFSIFSTFFFVPAADERFEGNEGDENATKKGFKILTTTSLLEEQQQIMRVS